MQHENGAPTTRLQDSVDPILLGLDRQIQSRTGIWRSPWSIFGST